MYRSTAAGVERLHQGMLSLPRHRHALGYATVVIAGSFVEASFAGRFAVDPGDVLLHAAFDCHANSARAARHVEILRLPWSHATLEGRFRVDDPDRLARICERDPRQAELELSRALRPAPRRSVDWPEDLAAALSRPSAGPLREWAEARGLAAETLSRGFRRAFGVSPKAFRLESRARRAWRRVLSTGVSLSAIAQDLGFADLAHMTRSIRALTGLPPSGWRRSADRVALLRQLPSSRAR